MALTLLIDTETTQPQKETKADQNLVSGQEAEGNRISLMFCRLDFQTRHELWVEVVGSSLLCSETIFPRQSQPQALK